MFASLKHNALSSHPAFLRSSVYETLRAQPLGFVDGGTRGGVHELVEPLAQHTAVLGFDADEEECKRLLVIPEVTTGWAAFALEPVALAEKEGSATLHLVSAPTNHSLLKPNHDLVKRYRMERNWTLTGEISLRTQTLDQVVFGPRAKESWWGEFIKLDTQGSEYEILLGADRTLRERTVAVLAEVTFCDLYAGQKRFPEVEQLLRGYGFSFYGFLPIHTRSRKLIDKRTQVTAERALYAEAVFFKDPLPGAVPAPTALSTRHIHVLFAAALLLHYYDFALELAQETWLKSASDAEKEAVETLVRDLASLPPETSAKAAMQLAKQVEADPSKANLAVGNFVDRRRTLCDYDDVLHISPLPKML